MRTLIVTLILSVTFIGCSANTKISGTVKYEDGTALEGGCITFDNGRLNFTGPIEKEGRYSIGVKKDEGLPPGSYAVRLDVMPGQIGKITENGQNIAPQETVPGAPPTFQIEVGSRQKRVMDFTIQRPQAGNPINGTAPSEVPTVLPTTTPSQNSPVQELNFVK